ncbi:hypothetical protein QYE76_014530 [Lolium multiflorum]|uniref:RNase H type-1 domain-containing protein n=1 Tax=Lolium multiflorum TaxID=4521 RepID=A0AAD8X5K0_LOLMU|nr:hypothetical protein QYE76_014530 [Lolium multiflorum]
MPAPAPRINENQDGAFGFVLRSDTGTVIATGAGKLYHLHSALQAEANACVAAIEATANLGIYQVKFESDSCTLVNAIKHGGFDLASPGVLIREARSLSILHFDHADFLFCRRGCNKVSHSLARYGYQASVPSSSWMDDPPEFVIGLVASDIAGQQV